MSRREAAAPDFWGTLLWRCLLTWMVLCVLLAMGLAPLGEAAPWLPITRVLAGVVFLPALVFTVWTIVSAIRRPRLDWPGPLVLAGFAASFIFGLQALTTTGVRLHFLWRRPTYERIIAEAAAGRLPLNERGLETGRRWGASYFVRRQDGRVRADFRLTEEFVVIYDEWDCYGRDPPPPPPPLPAGEENADPPTLKQAGRLWGLRWALSDDACLSYVAW